MRRTSDAMTDADRNLAESVDETTNLEGKENEPSMYGGNLYGHKAILDDDTFLDNDTRVFTPPPHIAARFYKPTNNRRKTSAASSRRNSISSSHSHQSHVSNASYHGRTQSNHIAQHLRRASIIEDRKARLADRAAHAEKVRLRAALAKAAPRSTNNSEERALAAQLAREKNLAEIVANCAEEVKRAKGIAESMKEKREAMGNKLRREMEERLADAEKRRKEVLNRGNARRARSTSAQRKRLSPMPEIVEGLSEEAAARVIQRQWRLRRRMKALKAFTDLGLSIEGIRDTSFEAVGSLLAEERVLVATAQTLRVCGLKEGDVGSVAEMTAVRTFLSAFLILGHPAQVLSNNSGEQEQVGTVPGRMRRDDLANPQLQDLVGKARDLLISFEIVLSRLTPTNNYTSPPVQLAALAEAYHTFHNAFIAWKARDSSTLVEMMVAQFVELDKIWQSVKDSTEEAVVGSYRDGIRDNQMMLMVRIKRLAGEEKGKQLITRAVREARRSKPKKPMGDVKPRAAAPDTPPATPVFSRSPPSHDPVATHLTTPPPTPPHRIIPSSNQEADRLRTSTSVLPDNRVIIHELAINKEYRIDAAILEERAAVNRVMFDTMRREIQVGNGDAWVFAMAENIRTKLQRFLTPGNSLYAMVAESLDKDVVSRELQSGSFSYEKFFRFMSTLLPRLCAPVRDAEVKELVSDTMQQGDVVDRLAALMHFIDLMGLDYANYMLQQGAPELLKQAFDYEHTKFAELTGLSDSQPLPVTERLWAASKMKLFAEAAKRDPEGVDLPKNRPTPDRIYMQMLADLFMEASALNEDDVPETLRLDTKRISKTRLETLHIVTAGAILLQTKNMLKRDVRSQWKTEATRIFSVLEGSKTVEQAVQGICAALEASHSMPTITKSHIRDLVTRIITQSQRTSQAEAGNGAAITDPVMRLLHNRLRAHVLARLSATTATEKVRAASSASEQLAASGLPEFVGSVGRIVEEMGKVGEVDRRSHGKWYELVAGRC